jgi:polysaccharide pyruvyl transferase WcaK-like protein
MIGNFDSNRNISRNLLLIGDYRPGQNFGAIATSTSLIAIAKQSVGEQNLSIIDQRSFKGLSPRSGYGVYSMPKIQPLYAEEVVHEHRQSSIRSHLKNNLIKIPFLRNGIQFIRSKVKKSKLPAVKATPIPTKFEDFDSAARMVMNGDIMHFEYQLLQRCDAVYVNGEGNIVNNIHNKGGDYRIGARYILFLIYLAAKYFHKPCAIVNHIVDPDQEEPREMIRRIYPLCKHVLVRDPFSLEVLENIGFSNARYIPDALFNYTVNPSLINRFKDAGVIDFDKPYVCIGDSASSGYVDWSIENFYKQIIGEVKHRYGQVVVVDGGAPICSKVLQELCEELGIFRITVGNTTFEELGAILAHSKAFISGRWHASILATLSGTPSVLFGTDSHKTRALHSMANLSSSFYKIEELPYKINELLFDLEVTLSNEMEIRERLKVFSQDCKEKTQYYFEVIQDLIS